MLYVCQAGFETLLGRELGEAGFAPAEQGPGWVLAGPSTARASPSTSPELAFSHYSFPAPIEISAPSVNALAQKILDAFAAEIKGERIESAWTCHRRGGGRISGTWAADRRGRI